MGNRRIPRKTFKNRLDAYMSIPRDKWVVTEEQLRYINKDFVSALTNKHFLRIYPDLLTPYEWDLAICRGALRFNNYKFPKTPFSPANFPDETLLQNLSLIEVLTVLINYHAQNIFRGASGGVEIDPHKDQLEALRVILNRLDTLVLDDMLTMKNVMSTNSGYSSTSREGYGFY